MGFIKDGRVVTFTLEIGKLVDNHILVAFTVVWQYFLLIPFVNNILRCFVANSLFLQFT